MFLNLILFRLVSLYLECKDYSFFFHIISANQNPKNMDDFSMRQNLWVNVIMELYLRVVIVTF